MQLPECACIVYVCLSKHSGLYVSVRELFVIDVGLRARARVCVCVCACMCVCVCVLNSTINQDRSRQAPYDVSIYVTSVIMFIQMRVHI